MTKENQSSVHAKPKIAKKARPFDPNRKPKEKCFKCEHILVIRILSLSESTRRYDKSILIIIVSHIGSDRTYTDTYQVWTLVHDRYRSERIHILILRRREYP